VTRVVGLKNIDAKPMVSLGRQRKIGSPVHA
jgi:hypothetical protein